jgi:probable phosphoglycerate mutase
VRLLVLARHGESLLNVAGRVNGDPGRDPGLSDRGAAEARRLGQALCGLTIDLVVVSAFPRAARTAELALDGRDVETIVDPDLGDVRLGDLEGCTLADYRAAPAHGDRDACFPGGESLNGAAARYVRAWTRLLARPEPAILVVAHEIVVRYALNGALGSDALDRPVHAIGNAVPHLFDAAGLRRACDRVSALCRARPGRPTP